MRSSNISLNSKRNGPVRSSGGSGGIPKSRVSRSHHHSQNGEYAVEFDYSLVKKLVTDNAAAPPLFIAPPYLGTYYYNGVPSYSNMDPSSLKEAIRKQM